MSTGIPVRRYLTELFHEYRYHIYARDVMIDVPRPTLTNRILPMFVDRWATGKDQNTPEFHHKLEPALQLASLFLSEDAPLLWFSHLTFGKRRRKSPTSSEWYTLAHPYSLTHEALATVKENLREFGKAVTFMFAPLSVGTYYWGVTYCNPCDAPFAHEYKESDFPPVCSRQGHARPLIAMARNFDVFFRYHYSPDASIKEKYRALLMFACTIVHEVAHAYNFWLGHRHEPLWDANEKSAELGFSWETNVFGHILNPVSVQRHPNSRFPYLVTIKLEECATRVARDNIFAEIRNHHKDSFTSRDVSGRRCEWPLLDTNQFRGACLSLSDNATTTVVCMQAIPTHWILNWFQKDFWAYRKQVWLRSQMYQPPPLENAFVLIYERNVHDAVIFRPLNAIFDTDLKILGDRSNAQERRQKAIT